MTKEDQLLMWILERKEFATHDVMKWGSDNFYNRAAKTARDFAKEIKLGGPGYISRLTPAIKKFHGWTCRDGIYAVNADRIRNHFKGEQKVMF